MNCTRRSYACSIVPASSVAVPVRCCTDGDPLRLVERCRVSVVNGEGTVHSPRCSFVRFHGVWLRQPAAHPAGVRELSWRAHAAFVPPLVPDCAHVHVAVPGVATLSQTQQLQDQSPVVPVFSLLLLRDDPLV
jgi:hypothetical protein